MTRIRLIAGSVVAFVAFVTAGVAMAQNASPTRLRGSISTIDGKTATLAMREGALAKVNLADNRAAVLIGPTALSEVKAGSFVGIASLKGADGVQNALEVLVFPEAARGSNEGHYPWDLQPESMMTNAAVATVAAAGDGQTLTLKYKDGSLTAARMLVGKDGLTPPM